MMFEVLKKERAATRDSYTDKSSYVSACRPAYPSTTSSAREQGVVAYIHNHVGLRLPFRVSKLAPKQASASS